MRNDDSCWITSWSETFVTGMGKIGRCITPVHANLCWLNLARNKTISTIITTVFPVSLPARSCEGCVGLCSPVPGKSYMSNWLHWGKSKTCCLAARRLDHQLTFQRAILHMGVMKVLCDLTSDEKAKMEDSASHGVLRGWVITPPHVHEVPRFCNQKSAE